jgi:hypothetical protein
MEEAMRVVPTVAALALLIVTSACQDFADDFKGLPPVSAHPFADDQSQNVQSQNDQSKVVSCSSNGMGCTSDGDRPSVQAPTPQPGQSVQ